jgi:type IX secretion system substrate protein
MRILRYYNNYYLLNVFIIFILLNRNMIKKLIYSFCFVVFFNLILHSQQTYQIDTKFEVLGIEYDHSLIIRIPDGVDVIRGILIRGNSGGLGSGGTTLYYVDDEIAYEYAKSINFAIMGTYSWGDFYYDGEIELFDECIQQFASLSGHQELVHAPMLFLGHSNGGMMAHGYNSLHPEKTIALLVNKGLNYLNPIPEISALKTPGILVVGENDYYLMEEHTNALFYNNRSRGALWSHIIHQGQGHTLVDETKNLFYLMADEALKLRYPSSLSPVSGPVTLLDIDETIGWLSDSTTWKNGVIEVFDYNSYLKLKDSSSWHISKDLAYLFAAHSSYNRIDYDSYFTSHVVDSGSISSFHFEVNEPWDSIHVFNKYSIIGSYYDSNESVFNFDVNLDSLGFYAVFAKVYLASGETSITNFDVVFSCNKCETVYIKDLIEKTDLLFYPNPCGDYGYLVSSVPINYYIIYTVDGRTIKEEQCHRLNKIELDFSSYQHGIYFLKTISENGNSHVTKIIK